MKISAARLREHIKMADGYDSFDQDKKRVFLRAAGDICRELLSQLGLTGNVHVGAGGPGVCGGADMYSEDLFVCVEPSLTRPAWFYYRGCDRLGDCGAGMRWANQSVPYSRLLELLEPDSRLIQQMRAHVERARGIKKGV